jgi:large subunit ribosomal protein L13
VTYLVKPRLHHPDLPKNKLGDHMLKRLKVYKGTRHPHATQNPQPIELKLK